MPATKPMQTKLRLAVELRSPLMGVAAVRGMLGAEFDEDDVLELIDNGDLRWAWNVAVPTAARREIRVLSHCVKHYQATLGSRPFPLEDWGKVWPLVMPHDKPFIEARLLAKVLIASSDLMLDLIRSGALQTLPGTDCRRGRGGSPLVTRESFIRFLTNRRING